MQKSIISIIMPSLNEATKVVRSLDSISRQTYPHDKLDVIFADAYSSDATRELIEKWRSEHDISIRIFDNPKIIAEFGTAIALKHAEGEFFCIQGCDHELFPEDALETFVNAFRIFPDIAGVEQAVLKVPDSSMFNNYSAVTGFSDPLARQIITIPKLLEKQEINGKHYEKYRFSSAYPVILFFNRETIAPFIERETFEEGQVMLELALSGKNKLARINGYGYRHHHAASFMAFLKKRIKIACKYTTRRKERKTWVEHTGKRIYLFAFFNLTFVGTAAYSIVKAMRTREPLWLLHAPICFAATATYIVSWLWIKITGKRAW